MSPLSSEAFLWNKAQVQGKMDASLLVMLSKKKKKKKPEGLSKGLVNLNG